MISPHRRPRTVSIIPERKHARPAGTRLITRSTTVRPFVYNLPTAEHSQERPSNKSERKKVERKGNIDKKYNPTISSLDDSLANETQISTKSFYSGTPATPISSRKKRYINRTLLKEFNLTQEVPEIDTSKTSDSQKEFQQKSLNNLPQQESVGTEKFRSPRKVMIPRKSLQKIPNTSQSECCNRLPQEESIIMKRKNSYSTYTAALHETSQIRCSGRTLASHIPKQSPNISHPEFSNCSPQEETIITKRKNRHSTTIAMSHEILQETSTVINKTLNATEIQLDHSPLTKRNVVNLSVMPSQFSLVDKTLTTVHCLQQTSLVSAIAVEENFNSDNNLENKMPDISCKPKSDLVLEESIRITKQCSVLGAPNALLQQSSPTGKTSALIIKTSTPIILKSIDQVNKNIDQISAISSHQNSIVLQENSPSTEAIAKNRKSGTCIVKRLKKANTTIQENICETSPEIIHYQNTKIKKCSVVLDYIPFPSKYLMKETIEETSVEEEQNENNELSNYNERINVKRITEDENAENKEEHEKGVSDERYSININKENEQEELPSVRSEMLIKPVTSVTHTSLENSISQLKNQSESIEENILTKGILDTSLQFLNMQQKTSFHSVNTNNNNEQEEILLVSSTIPTKPANSFKNSQLEHGISPIKNQTECAQINTTLTKQISSDISPQSLNEQHKTLPTVENISSKMKIHPLNLASENDDPEHTKFELSKPLFSQGRKLRHSSSEHFAYNAIVGGVRRTVSKQSRKSKHKTKPNSSADPTADKHSLFEGHGRIKIWKGKTGKRSISDVTDLDIALNVIDQVIEEISEEDQKKKELIQLIQEKYHNSLQEMIKNVQSIKKRKKEVKELVATVKELAGELDQIVDHKLRLQSEFLELKAQRKIVPAETSGPTWEDINDL